MEGRDALARLLREDEQASLAAIAVDPRHADTIWSVNVSFEWSRDGGRTWSDPALKLKGREGKYVFKKALEPYLPRDVLYRPKMGFAVPLKSWFRGPLRERVRQIEAQALSRLRHPTYSRRLKEYLKG